MTKSTMFRRLFTCGIVGSISLNIVSGLYIRNEMKKIDKKFDAADETFHNMNYLLRQINNEIDEQMYTIGKNVQRLIYVDSKRNPYEVNVNLLKKLNDILKEDVDIKESLRILEGILDIEMVNANIDHLETLGYTKDYPELPEILKKE